MTENITVKVITDYIRLFRTTADRHNSILMSFFLLVAETIKHWKWDFPNFSKDPKSYVVRKLVR